MSTSNDWGGQLEIQALCSILHTQINIHSAETDTVSMGMDDHDVDALPLELSYHKAYYTLGEHYNSVVAAGGGGGGRGRGRGERG